MHERVNVAILSYNDSYNYGKYLQENFLERLLSWGVEEDNDGMRFFKIASLRGNFLFYFSQLVSWK